ncbi:unnamed protein product, partial [Rotaria socialis]
VAQQCYVPITGRALIPYETEVEMPNKDFEDKKEEVTEIGVLEQYFKITRITYSNTSHGNIIKVIWLIEEKVQTDLMSYYVNVTCLTKYFKLMHVLPLHEELMDSVYRHIGAHAQNIDHKICSLDFQFRKLTLEEPQEANREVTTTNPEAAVVVDTEHVADELQPTASCNLEAVTPEVLAQMRLECKRHESCGQLLQTLALENNVQSKDSTESPRRLYNPGARPTTPLRRPKSRQRTDQPPSDNVDPQIDPSELTDLTDELTIIKPDIIVPIPPPSALSYKPSDPTDNWYFPPIDDECMARCRGRGLLHHMLSETLAAIPYPQPTNVNPLTQQDLSPWEDTEEEED